MPREGAYDAVAGLFIALAAGIGIGITANLDWPVGPDLYRDIAAAQTIKSGNPLADPFYAGEWIWYNPLVPSLVAALAAVTHAPIHIVETRGGAYLNVLVAVSFYWLATVLLTRRAALGALAAFLFLQLLPSWKTASYSPWLFVSNFAQCLFYVSLAVWIRYLERPAPWKPAFIGFLVGLTFLAHTAPAVLLGVFILASSVLTRARHAESRWSSVPALHIIIVVAVACVVAAPFLYSILWHYRGRVANPLPILWLDPEMLPPNLGRFAGATLGLSLLNIVAAVGLLGTIRRDSTARAVLGIWAIAASVLFAYSAYVWRLANSPVFQRLAIVPAHHFLIYFHAAIAMLFGEGFDMTVAGISKWIPGRRLNTSTDVGVSAGLLLIIIALYFPAYLRRDDNAAYAKQAAQAFTDIHHRAVFDWIANSSPRNAVFLAPENVSLSTIAPAGRKVLLVDRFFSNPYVDWRRRHDATTAMWNSLAAADCRAFSAFARSFVVTHVMLVSGATPVIPAGRCGLEMGFQAGDFAILHWTDAAKP